MESGSICFSNLECSDREVQSLSQEKQGLCLVEITGQVYKAIVNQHLPGLAGTLRAVPPPTIKSLVTFLPSPVWGLLPGMSHGDLQEAGGILPVLPSEGVQTVHTSPEILRNRSVTGGLFSSPYMTIPCLPMQPLEPFSFHPYE